MRDRVWCFECDGKAFYWPKSKLVKCLDCEAELFDIESEELETRKSGGVENESRNEKKKNNNR